MATIALCFMGILLVALLLEPLARRLHLPFSAALALLLPLELEGWWTVQSIAYGVVVFSLFVQAPLLKPLVRWLQGRGHLRV